MLVFGAPTPARSVPSRVWCSTRHLRAPTTASEGPFMTISEGSHDDLCPLGPYNGH